MGYRLLLENGAFLLLEDGGYILIDPTNFTPELTDSLPIIENTLIKFNNGYILSLEDGQTITETVQPSFVASQSLLDSISISEEIEVSLSVSLSVEDNMGISESVANKATTKLTDSLASIEEMIEIEYTEGNSIKSDWKFLIKTPAGVAVASLTNARKRWLVQRINDEQEAGFILDADDEKCNSTILSLGVNELHIYYKDVLKWAGQLVSAKKTAKGNDIYWEVLVKDWVALLGKRYCGVEAVREFVTTDSSQIIKTLVQETQALPNGSFGITYGTFETSLARSITYDRKNILDALKELSNAGQDGVSSFGVDFEITPEKELNVYYPYKGTIREGVVFRYPGNCEDFESYVDSWGIVNQEWGLGRHWTGNTANVSRSDATSQTLYKRREAIKSYNDVSILQFLQDMVYQDVQWLKDPSNVFRFSSRVDTKSRIQDYEVGDGVTVICDSFDVNEWLWVYERKIEIGENDELNVTLTVGD